MGKRSTSQKGQQNHPSNPTPHPSRRFSRIWIVLFVFIVGIGLGAILFHSGSDRPSGPAPEGMVWIPGGTFFMGTDDAHRYFADARPEHEVEVDGFWIDETELTNEQFAKLVEATGYKTIAEQAPAAEQFLTVSPPGTEAPDPKNLIAGSLVFTPPEGPVAWNNPGNWWAWVPGACWNHPEGPGSDISSRMNHPVVQVCWKDADAYAKWAGKRLPTEAEWERAARGGLGHKAFVWGDEILGSGGRWQCNIWQGEFPWKNTLDDGYLRTAPVKSYPPNEYGLYEMAGNVWEWCSDWYAANYYLQSPRKNPKGPEASYDPDSENPYLQKRVQRGGSYLCSDGFCGRYRPYGRGKGDVDTGQSHVGFRCVKDAK